MPQFELSKIPKKPESEDIALIVVAKNNILYDECNKNIFFTCKELDLNIKDEFIKNNAIYIGKLNGKEIYAMDIPDFSISHLKFTQAPGLLEEINIRMIPVIFRTMQLLNWNRASQYCGCCSKKTTLDEKEFVKNCISCGQKTFPQYSPAMLVRVTRGNEVLLGRSYHFKKGMYSTLAGFAEAGESIEDTVRREVREEVGIEIKNIKYFSTQPWPFPNSLMIGFTAEYESGELKIDKNELEDAQWFKADQLPPLPMKSSIAYQIIDDFVQNHQSQNYSYYQPSFDVLDKFISTRVAAWLFALPGVSSEKLLSSSNQSDKSVRFNPLNFALNKVFNITAYALIQKKLQIFCKQHFDYPLLSHPVTTSYCTGVFIPMLYFGFSKINSSNVFCKILYSLVPGDFIQPSITLNKLLLNMHHGGLFSCSILGIHPLIKHKLNTYITNPYLLSSTAIFASSTAFTLLVLPTVMFNYYQENLSVPKIISNFVQNKFTCWNLPKGAVRQATRYMLWNAPVVGLAGEMASMLAENKFCFKPN